MKLKKIIVLLCMVYLSTLQLTYAGLETDFKQAVQDKNFQKAYTLLQEKDTWPAALLDVAFFDAVNVDATELHTDFVHLLVEKGLDLKKLNVLINPWFMATPIQLVLLKDHYDLFNQLIQSDPQALFVEDSRGETLLHLAAAKGHVNFCKNLIQNEKFNVDAVGPENKTPLYYAVRFGHTDVVLLLCNLGADVNVQTEHDGYTPLTTAICTRGSALIDKLLEYQNIFPYLGQPYIQDVQKKEYYALIDKLIKAETIHCDVNHCPCVGCELIRELRELSQRYHQIIEVLLEYKADVSLVSSLDNQYTALHAAITRCDDCAVREILMHLTLEQFDEMHEKKPFTPHYLAKKFCNPNIESMLQNMSFDF